MILFVNPRATRPKNRRFPLSIMSLGAALPPEIVWDIVDGNLPGADVFGAICETIDRRAGTADPVEMLAITVLPGPQLVSAVPLSKALKRRYPTLPIAWGGYFPSLYPTPVLNADYIDWIVRGQGEATFLELLDVIRGKRDPETVAGLGFRRADGSHFLGPERKWIGPAELPDPPYHKIDVAAYLQPTILGRRSGVYQASIGCPHACSFCGVISVYGRREKVQASDKMHAHLKYLVETHGMDSLHFYDNNFFLNEPHAREIAQALMPLGLKWWCEARVDTLCRFSEETWRMLKASGLQMIFCGAESGSDEVLRKMSKGTTTAQIAEVAARTREHGIIPEFSFVFGDPDDPEREIANTLGFIRKLKIINPAMELITYFYTPTPQRAGTYGDVDAVTGTPVVLDEWMAPEWVSWMTHEDPHLPWLDRRLKDQVDDFRTVLMSRFPSIHDRELRPWGKVLASWLARRRWAREDYARPRMLRHVQRLARRKPDDRQAYGHLRPPGDAAAA